MGSVVIAPSKLGMRLRLDAKLAPLAVQAAMVSGAHRGRSYIIRHTPVDRGVLKNAWRILTMLGVVDLVNSQPYAGVIERGARPFKISREGLENLVGWVKRKLIGQGHRDNAEWAARRTASFERDQYGPVSPFKQYGPKQRRAKSRVQVLKDDFLDKEARRIAWAIAKKFERLGMKGKFFIRQNLPTLVRLAADEINRFLSKYFNSSNPKSLAMFRGMPGVI